MKKKFDVTIVERYTAHYIVDAETEEEAMLFINAGLADPDNEEWEYMYHEVVEL